MSRSAPWNIADLVDFEVLLAAENSGAGSALRESELAAIRLKLGAESGRNAEQTRRDIFRLWLAAGREKKGASLPGQHLLAGWQTLLTVAALAGLLLGGSVTGALLHYHGDEPVNVSWFFACTVGVQMLFLVGALGFWLLARLPLFENFHPLRAVLTALIWLFSAGLRRLPGEQREGMRAAFALFSRHRDLYGMLAVWALLLVTQLFAVCYNLGILAILLAHIAATDLAFGWQSTLHASPEAAYRLVSAVAAPWAWCAPQAHPSLDQVVASRFQYSAGLQPLSPVAMAAWWPFLAYAVAFYGLLLRGGLFVWAWVKGHAALRGLRFDHQSGNALFRRLTGPLVQAGENEKQLRVPEAAAHGNRPAPIGNGLAFVLIATDFTAGGETALSAAEADASLVHGRDARDDRRDARPTTEQLTTERLALQVREVFGWQLAGAQAVQIDHPSGNADAFAALAAAAENLAAVLVLVRAKRSPIKAIALFLQKVVAISGPKAEVILLLGGGAAEDAWEHWRNFLLIQQLPVSLERWEKS